jgi:hypothetical protein
MTVGKAIYNLLLSNADLRAIVDTRIFPEVAQQDAVLPYVVYNVSSNEPSDTKREPSKLDTAQIEVNLYSTSYTECIDMATHTRAALDRVTGTYSGVNVQSIQYLGEIIDFDEAQRTYNITADYDVRISRSDFEIAQGSPITGVTLGELSDVDTTGVTDGQVIAYDAAAQEWQPADDAGGVTELGQLTDVQFGQGGPETGELLKYDGSEWTNDSIVKSEVGLGNVDNTSDANKPVSTATQTELNAKANSADFSNVDNTSDADKPISTATQTALNAKADTSAVPTDLNDLSDVTIVGTPAGNQALIYDATAGAFKSLVSYTNRFEDEVETGKQGITGTERAYSVKGEGDGVFADPESDTPAAGKVIVRKIYHKTGFITDADVIGDYTLIHTFADDTAYADTVATFEGFEDGATYGVPPFTLLQTWEEVDEASLLLDTYTGASGAYSLRKLRTLYTGDAIRVRRANNDEQDIGFSNDELDTVSLLAFAGSGDAFVKTFYDQSGNSNDATQTTTASQPKIVSSGSVITENGKPAVEFDGSDDRLLTGVDLLIRGSFSVATATGTGAVFASADFGSEFLRSSSSTQYQLRNNVRMNLATDTTSQSLVYAANDTTSELAVNGATAVTDAGLQTDAFDSLALGSGTAYFLNGNIQEVIIYETNQTDNRTDIESNINTFYDIF